MRNSKNTSSDDQEKFITSVLKQTSLELGNRQCILKGFFFFNCQDFNDISFIKTFD